jgi:hypothetical protein
MRANMNMGNPHAPKEKSAANFYTRHAFEYFIQISKAGAADDKADLLGNKLESDTIKDFKGNKDITGHKIYFKMADSSLGTPNRTGQLTIDYKLGIINTHEEVFELGRNTGIIELTGNRFYTIEGVKHNSKEEALEALKDKALQKIVLERVRLLDANC